MMWSTNDNAVLKRMCVAVVLFAVSAFLFLGLIGGVMPYTISLVLFCCFVGLMGLLVSIYSLFPLSKDMTTSWNTANHSQHRDQKDIRQHRDQKDIHKEILVNIAIVVGFFVFLCMPYIMSIAFFITTSPVFVTLWHIPLIAIPVLATFMAAINLMPDDQHIGWTVGQLILSVIVGCIWSFLPILSLILWLTHPVLIGIVLPYYGVFMGLTVLACLGAALYVYTTESAECLSTQTVALHPEHLVTQNEEHINTSVDDISSINGNKLSPSESSV